MSEVQEIVEVELDDVAAEQETPEVEASDETESDDAQEEQSHEDQDPDVRIKKMDNAIKRRDKKLAQSNARLRELEAKLAEAQKPFEPKNVNPDDFETMDEYFKAQTEAAIENKFTQNNTDQQKAQLDAQKQQIIAERNEAIIEQANEVSQTLTDLPQVWRQNAAILNALPEQVTEMFYSLDNAPVAIYTLAKEGRLADLAYMNPHIAAQEIYSAQQRGAGLLRPRTQQTAPEPMRSAKGGVKTTKDLSKGSVLKNLGLKD